MSVTEAQIASVGGDIARGKTYAVRGLWAHTDLASWTASGTYTTPATVPVNDVFMIRLWIPVGVLPPFASVKVTEMRVQSESERVFIHPARSGPLSIRLVNVKGETVYSKHHRRTKSAASPRRGCLAGFISSIYRPPWNSLN